MTYFIQYRVDFDDESIELDSIEKVDKFVKEIVALNGEGEACIYSIIQGTDITEATLKKNGYKESE